MTKFKTNVFKCLLIPAIAILALLCFAPKANAFNNLDYNSFDSVLCFDANPRYINDYDTAIYIYNLYSDEYYAYVFYQDSTVTGCALDYIICDSALDFYIENNNISISSESDVLSCINNLFYSPDELGSYYSYYAQHYFDSYNNSSNSGYTEEELEEILSEAKAGAVEEYKSSDDYTSTINLAKTAGVEEYKKSDSYASVLTTRYNNGYSEGLAAGELSYKTSSENKAALEGEYNKGFDTGFVEGQKKVNVGPVIAGVCILAVVALALVIVTRKKKNKFRR